MSRRVDANVVAGVVCFKSERCKFREASGGGKIVGGTKTDILVACGCSLVASPWLVTGDGDGRLVRLRRLQ